MSSPAAIDRVFEAIDAAAAEIVDFTAALIRIPTINPPGDAYEQCARFIGARLEQCGFEVSYVAAEGLPEHTPALPRVNVVGSRRGRMPRPNLHLNGHFDVVPAGGGWTVDPFGGVVRDGRIYGRGACDMKAGLAAAIYAVEAIRRAGIALEGSVEVSGTVDEESGGFAGVAYLTRQGWISADRTDAVIIPEPLNVDRICIGHRGVYWFEVTTRGRIGHGSMPFLGVNAIEHMGLILDRIRRELIPALALRETEVPVVPPLARHATLNINGIAGGQPVDGIQTPCVADWCTAIFDRRFLLEEGFEATKAEIETLLEREAVHTPGLSYVVRDRMVVHPVRTPSTSPVIGALERSIQRVLGRPAEHIASPGTYDHKHVDRIAGIPHCVAYGPGILDLAHQPDEWCSIDDLINATKVLALAVLDLTAPRVLALLVVVLALSMPGLAAAQATGTITGVVSDPDDAAVPGATIEVTSADTNQSRTTVTSANGFYTVPLLQPGSYLVKASLSGFRTTQRDGIRVTVESTIRVDFKLALAGVVETLVIDAEPPLVDTSSAQLGIVVDEKKIVELPLNGRNFTQLGTLLPGVMAPPAALGGAAGDATPGGFGAATSGFSVNGMRNQSNNFLLDGVSNNDTFNTGFVTRPPPDAIQEFKILTHSYSAEYGRNAGSVVNVVTRAGSNVLRGAAWEFNRDDALQARNYFAPSNQPKPKLQQNQFGGSLGGPFVRNRLFGFGYYEGYRNTSGTTTNIVVLSDAERGGDFSGGAVIRDPLTGTPFPGNVIPAARLDPAAERLIDDFLPRANSAGNRFIESPDSRDERDQFGTRIDYQISSGHSVLGRYLRTKTDIRTPATTRPIGGVALATLQDWMFSDTFTISPNAINVARFSYNRIGAHPAVTSGLLNSDYLINVPHNLPAAQGLANIMVTGFFNLGDAQQPFVDRVNKVLQFTDDVTWVRGTHSLKMGIDMRREHMVIAFVNRPNGDYTFTGSPTQRSGNAAADFLLGLPAQFRRTTANTIQDGTGWLYAGYMQDDFRPWPRLTVNAGLRYELPLPFVDKNDALNSFRPGQQSTRFREAPTGLVYPGDAGVPRGTYATDKNNLSPRLGVAWDPTGTGRSSLRSAWGIFYDALAGQGDFFQNGVLAPPFTPLLEVNAPPAALTLRDPLSVVSGGATGFPPGLTFIGWGTDFTTPYAHHFNVTWQQQLGGRLAGEIGYVGSRGFNLPIFIEVNPGLYTSGQTTAGARLFPAFALVRPTFSVARSWYDSLQASLRLQQTRGLTLLASYTLGHARDHVSGLNIGGEQRPVLPVTIGDDASIERALTFEKGDALFDARHRFVVSFSAELPTPTSMGSVIEHLTGGWQLNGIVQAQTGFPTTVFDPSLSIRYLTNRPNQICDPNAGAPRTVDQWFTTSCFVRRALADTAEPGSTPRDSVRGPGFARTDLSLFKNVVLTGTHRLQFRVEAFNLFNQTRFGQPGNQIGTANFGRITSADDGRIIQLAAKYSF